ncbi:MAG: hypothetical protein P0Y65_05565 [Candidatus Devosia phytovorans]|uniref:Uncharacterized protein n=1 Tax=Candidatus Devosia phytovorans TaxID=3121372 RepID=A0AAJ6B0Y8_9HYPH|nr:hypothetical protein [Devosia sp.]WEK05722.1 MAG: hypothetical protein P0Y65_05565 [Devosia sp.]
MSDHEELTTCEGCSKPIHNGDRYHRGGDVDLCEECAPDYLDLLVTPNSFTDADGGPLTAETAQAIFDEHIAAGGSAEDKMVSKP